MKSYLYIAGFIGGLALLGGAFTYGYHKGSVNEIAKIAKKTAQKQEELFDLADTVSEQSAKLLQLQREKKELSIALEQQATSAPGSNNPGISTTGGMSRLERRWGKSAGSSK